MPKIPTYLASFDYKPPRGDLDTAALPGQMLAKFGESVGEFGGKIAKQTELADRMKQAQAEATRANGTAQAMAALRQTIADFDADTDPGSMMDRYLQQAHGIRQGIADGIGDSQVRAQVEEDTAGIFGVRAALMQGDRVRGASAKGRQDLGDHLTLYGNIAADARHPLEFDEAIDLAVGEIRRKAKVGILSPGDAEHIEQTFYADLAERQARKTIAADPQSALASLKGGEDFATLPAEYRARLIDEADRAVQDQAVAHTTAAAADRRAIEIRLPGFIGALRDGAIPGDDRFTRDSLIATFGDEDGARYWTEIEDARAFGKATARVKWATPDEITRLLDADHDSVSPDEAASHRPWLSQAVERRNQQLWSRPADYALANPRIAELHEALHQTTAQPKIPAALTAALQANGMPAPASGASDEDRHAATEAYANATLAEQARLGLPADRRQVLPKAMAQELVARILDGDTKAAADILSDLIATWGDAAPIALADLNRHGLPGEYRLLASFTDPAARQIFAKVLTAQATEPGMLRGKAGDDADEADRVLRAVFHPLGDQSDNRNIIRVQGPGGLPQQKAQASPQNNPSSQSTNTPSQRPYTGDNFPRRNAVDLHDANGKPVMGIDAQGNPQQIRIPEGVDLRVFAKQGEEDRNLPGEIRSDIMMERLKKFAQSGSWDLQRPRDQKDSQGKQINYPEFVDVATVAIGIYCAAAGLTRSEALLMQRVYAIGHSDFGNAKRSLFHYPLPERNVQNTNLGYDLYSNDTIPGPAE